MSLNFPINPVDGQSYQPAGLTQTYTYGQGKWSVSYVSATAISASHAVSASYVDIVGDGITVNYSGAQIQLTGSGGGGSAQDLQSVTTAGNFTTSSVIISASLTQGETNQANGLWSHAEGGETTAGGDYSHAEGGGTKSVGLAAHSEGLISLANGDYSHAEGLNTVTLGTASHAEGQATITVGQSSHAEGRQTTAIGTGSHSEGTGSIALGHYSHAQGQWNIARGEQSNVTIGNGTSNSSRSNLFVALPTLNKIEITGSLNAPSITGSLSGSVSNIGDEYATPPCQTIVTLTALEYAAISPKNPNTLYFIV
jgi:hypothetical protein